MTNKENIAKIYNILLNCQRHSFPSLIKQEILQRIKESLGKYKKKSFTFRSKISTLLLYHIIILLYQPNINYHK